MLKKLNFNVFKEQFIIITISSKVLKTKETNF